MSGQAGASSPPGSPEHAEGALLASYAARVVAAALTGVGVDGRPPARTALRAIGASFVTLHHAGVLRGCVGSLEAVRPLYIDVARNAVRATTDPRLEKVTAAEWPGLDISVSVLGPIRPMPVTDLADLLGQIRPTVDGLVISVGARRATFLPGVWEKMPDPAVFVAALLAKGGWQTNQLPVGAKVRRYEVGEFHNLSPRPALPAPPSEPGGPDPGLPDRGSGAA